MALSGDAGGDEITWCGPRHKYDKPFAPRNTVTAGGDRVNCQANYRRH
jgi:hypothetical protein